MAGWWNKSNPRLTREQDWREDLVDFFFFFCSVFFLLHSTPPFSANSCLITHTLNNEQVFLYLIRIGHFLDVLLDLIAKH